MSATVKVKAAITWTQGNLSIAQSRDLNITATGEHARGSVQDIGFAAHEALDVPAEIGTAGWAYFQNQDADNFVQIGVDGGGTFYPLLKLLPGEAQAVRLTTDTPYAKADTAAVKLYYFISEA
jgi:hypothetical protein